MTRASCGLANGARDGLAASVVASAAALGLLRMVLEPNRLVGGQFSYLGGASFTGRYSILTGLGAGVAGALIGLVFTKVTFLLKSLVWKIGAPSSTGPSKKTDWKQQVMVKTLVGLCVGLVATYVPQTLFWGEGSLQTVIDGHTTPFSATHHGLLPWLTSKYSLVDPSTSFIGVAKSAVLLSAGKLLTIALACAGKFPGGIIFPLFFAAAPLVHIFGASPYSGLWAMCLMAATQASVTRTPLASVLILTLSSSVGSVGLSAMLPAVILASYVGTWAAQLLSKKTYFEYYNGD